MLKNVLIITSEFPPGPGGIGNHAFHLALALKRKGDDVTVLTDVRTEFAHEEKKFDRHYAGQIRVVRVKRQGLRTYLNRIKRAVRLAKTHDIVFLTGKFSLWLGMLLRMYYGSGKEIIAIVHGSELQLKGYFSNRLTFKSLTYPDKIIAVSKFTRSLLPYKLQKQAIVIPNGVCPEYLKSVHPDEKFMLNGNPVLLSVGNVTFRKGHHRVIKALQEILKRFPGAVYHVIGLPTKVREMTEIARKMGVEDKVVFHGRLKDEQLMKAYTDADLFFMLSENQPDGDVEGFGIAILEANIFGVPAIGAAGCGIEDAIDGSNGLLVDGNDREAIARAVESILASPEKFREGSIRFAQRHDWGNLVIKYRSLYKTEA